jgi:hypothetical protein
MHLVDAWLTEPTAVVVEPAARHARTMASLLAPLGTAGNLTNDAHRYRQSMTVERNLAIRCGPAAIGA